MSLGYWHTLDLESRNAKWLLPVLQRYLQCILLLPTPHSVNCLELLHWLAESAQGGRERTTGETARIKRKEKLTRENPHERRGREKSSTDKSHVLARSVHKRPSRPTPNTLSRERASLGKFHAMSSNVDTVTSLHDQWLSKSIRGRHCVARGAPIGAAILRKG